ncbi:MAG: penicillin-binding transpeptidase domain-containing protein [Myxococcota bacterium]|nr:penicillin-binding transpeptidase domain-containing protein [Myxococcota bacterium]
MRRRAEEGRDTDDAARARLGLAPARRPRRRALSRRGWVTLAVGVASAGLLAGLAIPVGAPLLGQISDRIADDAEQHGPPRPVPEELLARLPNSSKVLELERTGSSQSAGAASAARPLRAPVDPGAAPRFVEWVEAPAGFAGPLRIEYALDAELGERVFALLRRARVKRGHVVVLDVRTGRVMAYASVDPKALPPSAAYPAASLAKVVTVAASLERDRQRAMQPCRYRGDPYRLNKARVHPARGGHQATLERALARSYNQCFAQLAVHALGDSEMQRAFARFRWHVSPAPGHSRGLIDRGEGDYGLGKLGAGLANSRITALYAAQLAGSLGSGELVDPWWIDRVVDTRGRELLLPPRGGRHRVMQQETADEVRRMLVHTTTNGTARAAFRTPRGPRLGHVRVAGKTGNLTGSAPHARYEWFAGTAPAEDPRVAVAVLQAHGHLWWKMSAQIAADVFAELFCEKRRCSAERVARYTGDLGPEMAPLLLGEANDAPSG